jgi:hypothetical protein
VGLGRCASVEETCAATAAECERMQARNTSL